MIELRTGTRICIAADVTDMRRGFPGLSAQVQMILKQQPFSGHVFVFRGRRGDTIKILWADEDEPLSCIQPVVMQKASQAPNWTENPDQAVKTEYD